jgi:Tol biopolymer transport system component
MPIQGGPARCVTRALRQSWFEYEVLSDRILVVQRRMNGGQHQLLSLNFAGQPQAIPLPEAFTSWAVSPDEAWLSLYIPDILDPHLLHLPLKDSAGPGWRVPLEQQGSVYTKLAWSPGGEWVYLSSAQTGYFELRRMRPDGSQMSLWEGAFLGGYEFTLSPDGDTAIFSILDYRGEEDGELLRLRFPDLQLDRLTDDQDFDFDPLWSPGGERLAVVNFADNRYTLQSLSPEGGERQILAGLGSSLVYPRWSADGGWLLFHNTRDTFQSSQIYKVRAGGGDLQALTAGPHKDSNPQWGPAMQADWRPGWAGLWLGLLLGLGGLCWGRGGPV